MSQHGTTTRYTSGCRCQRCRKANAEYQRAYQAKRRAANASTWFDSTPATTLHQDMLTAHWVLLPDARSPLEQTCDALLLAAEDLARAFRAHHAAMTEPVA